MPAEIVFSGGAKVEDTRDAQILMQRVKDVGEGPASSQGGQLPIKWLEVETEDGLVYVNTAEIAYVRDKRERSKAPHFS
ncbi:MAG TPA: hypothetical protein VGV57_11975 [Thermoleophilaceae bacterium]|nr:hypothetical protein [Thermoleophilaceae bacterium]